jgi:ubiquinone/menaquinone biosynthesis C-methylase UbiE
MKYNEKTFSGNIERLRRPERMAVLEVPRVVDLSIKGINPANVLDIGCGSGIFLEAFGSRGLFCAGIDFNPHMLRATRGFVTGARVAAATAEHLPFANKSIDLVFVAHVLHEVDDPAITLKEALRVCKKRISVLEWQYREEEIGPPLGHRLKPEDVGATALKVGLKSVKPIILKSLVLYLIEVNSR